MRPEERKGLAAAAAAAGRDQFPVGMRVLAVDDDPVCLKVLETLLRRCQYHVTTTNQAVIALRMLRENRDMFDLVISDVHMPDMDGFKLLELVGLEMDLPVIMLSVNGETKTVMKGITHGACDYLLKPVRIEELKNIWQHVVRRKFSALTCGSPDQSGRPSKKRKEYHSEDEDEDDESNGQDNDDPSAPKRPRVVWSVELHRKFVAAVNHLGIDKAVPKRILELMNVEKLTRENVASHLQKYRLYLRRLSAVASQQAVIVAALGGRDHPFLRMDAFEGLQGYQAFASPAALSSFSARGLLNSPRNNQAAVVIQGVPASRSIHTGSGSCTTNNSIGDANKYHLSLPGNQHGNLSQGLAASLGQAQLQQKWMNEDSGDLSTILSGNSLATGIPRTLQSVTSSPLLPPDLVECTQAKAAIQPSIRAPSVSLDHLEGAVGASSGPLESRVSQQNALPLSGFSASRLPVHGSFNNNGAARLGDAFSASFRPTNDLTVARGTTRVGGSSFGGAIQSSPDTEQKYWSFGSANGFRQKASESSAESLLDPKLAWSSSQLLGNAGAHHSISQRSSNGSMNIGHGARMFGQTSASTQTKIDFLLSGDASAPRNASESGIQRLQTELSSSTCSFDGLLNSMIKSEKDDVTFGDDLGCDFYSLGACI
ncbi:unnamed protein product [Alopecurus aequalis]